MQERHVQRLDAAEPAQPGARRVKTYGRRPVRSVKMRDEDGQVEESVGVANIAIPAAEQAARK